MTDFTKETKHEKDWTRLYLAIKEYSAIVAVMAGFLQQTVCLKRTTMYQSSTKQGYACIF